MVVTDSRLAAVRYKQSFDTYIRRKGYPIKTLVAFSGIVNNDKITGKTYSEVEMNGGIRESELPERFGSNEYQVLLVAEKYQTGFDQPLLHTMYVDKRLAGIQAVQTLSRLNRVHPLKEDTFVLDFVNKREEIQEAFKQYYEGAELGEEAQPNQLYQLKNELDASGIYLTEEVERFCAIYFKPKQRQSAADHQPINAALDPGMDRFQELLKENQEAADLWRKKVVAFCNLYAFLSQIMPYQDSDLERTYIFLRHLAAKLPRRSIETQYDLNSDVRLEYYRLQKIGEGSIDLSSGYGRPLHGPQDVGTSILRETDIALSQLIDIINERFGTDFNQADQLFFDQIAEAAAQSEELQQAAKVNSADKFTLLFRRLLEAFFVDRMDQNEEIFGRYMNDSSFQKAVSDLLASEVYLRLTGGELSTLKYK
jgi:type I restriction enzyme, R subunit